MLVCSGWLYPTEGDVGRDICQFTALKSLKWLRLETTWKPKYPRNKNT